MPPRDNRLTMADILVSVRDGQVILRSQDFDVELLPRLTSAHNPRIQSTGIYRFLTALQYQRTCRSLCWSWGPLSQAPHLPQVRYQRAILSPETWTVMGPEVRGLFQLRGADYFMRFQEWWRRRALPRIAAVVEGDNRLAIDSSNPLSARGLQEASEKP